MKTSMDLLLQKVENMSRERKRKMCGDKKRYTAESAEKARLDVENRQGWAMNTYRCEYCGSWHIGHAAKWTGRK